jgi:plasmid replication initiation protein
MAMALLPPDLSTLTASFTFTDFCKALGYGDGGEQYKSFRDAVTECLQCVINIETEPGKKGKTSWQKFTWFIYADFNAETGQATMKFSPELADVLKALKWVYAKINLSDLGKLSSRYAIKLYELAICNSFLKGKQGNQTNTWYTQWDIPDLRMVMGVPEGAYPQTKHLIQFVISKPSQEVSAAGIGFDVSHEGIKQGRNLVAVRLIFTQTARNVLVPSKGRKKPPEPPPELSTIELKTIDQRDAKEEEHLKELYPTEFADLYAAELAKPSFMPPTSEIRKLAAAGAAAQALKDRHGIVK